MSFISNGSDPLRALAQVNRELVQAIGRRCPDQRIATIDVDSTVIESWKREAQPAYQGTTGYQPMLALWAEMDLCVADEFRDGNVEALHDVLKNELAAGVMPCGRFGANAAWLRFQVFFSPGKLVHHARQILLKVGRLREQPREWAEGPRLLPATG